MKEMSRRSFLKAGTAATAALALTPGDLLAKAKASKKNGPTGKIKLLGVGVGGRGHADINGVTYKGKDEIYDDIEFIGMCDVDFKYAKGVLEDVRLYQFLREPLIRRFGEEWYAELEATAEALLNDSSSD